MFWLAQWWNVLRCKIHLQRRQLCQNFLHSLLVSITLQKHTYSNILKISLPENWKFSDKNSDIFHISAQNIDCGYSLELSHWGSSKEYPQSMFLSRNKKNNVYPCKPQFYYIKVRFKGGQNYIGMFSWLGRIYFPEGTWHSFKQTRSHKICHIWWIGQHHHQVYLVHLVNDTYDFLDK